MDKAKKKRIRAGGQGKSQGRQTSTVHCRRTRENEKKSKRGKL